MIGFCFLQEVVSRQYMDYIRDLEEDRFSLRSRVAELEAENTKLGQEVEEVQGGLEAKSERICQLRESLNVTNDKHSRLLREDLEKTVEKLRQGCTRGLVSSHPRKGER